MRSMFQNGFQGDVFGSRVGGSAMLGQVKLRGMGTVTTDRNGLLAKLQDAESKVAAVNQYVRNHVNLQTDLGGDWLAFQAAFGQVQQNASIETNVIMQLNSSPAGLYDIADDDYAGALAYAQGASQAYSVIQDHPGFATAPGQSPAPGLPQNPYLPQTPGTRPPGGAPLPAAKTDLTAPLLVGGGVFAIGVIALLARG